MNVFVTSECPIACAKVLDDKRVNKMIVESAQLLSTAARTHLGAEVCNELGLYKATHQRHPCTLWAAGSKRAYTWLLRHLDALIVEYKGRYGSHKEHATARLLAPLNRALADIPEGRWEGFVNCTAYKDEEVTLAYQLCLSDKWENDKRTPLWYGEGK